MLVDDSRHFGRYGENSNPALYHDDACANQATCNFKWFELTIIDGFQAGICI